MTSPAPDENPRARLDRLMGARRADLRLHWKDVAARAGLTTEGLRNVRFGTGEIRALTKRGIEDALGWEAGSVERILAGGEPTVRERRVPIGTAHESNEAGPVRPSTWRREITDEELRNSGLAPETVEALLRMRRRVERWTAERDEEAIRRADRIQRALEEEQDTA